MSTVHGSVAHGFEAVRQGFEEGQLSDEGGAQLCVYHNGRKVVDLWGGRDKVNDRPYTDKTVSVIFSCSKGVMATCAMMLAERGQLDLDAPVTRYWPEFGQAGKQTMPVSYLLSHQAGLSGFDPESGIGPRDLLDWEKCTTALAAMTPLWDPGTAYSYHAVTYGFLVGEVIRRITGQMPGQFFAENVARPLGLRLWIGLPESEEINVAPHFSNQPAMDVNQWKQVLTAFGIDPASRMARGMIHSMGSTVEAMALINSRGGHAAEIPAANGIGDAASLARMYAATIGEIDGVRLLKPETMERGRRHINEGMSFPADFAKFPVPAMPFAYGFGLPRPVEPMLGPGSFGHAGAGGRLGFAHPESGTAVGYVCNNMLWDGISGPDARWMPWTDALKGILKLQ